ncbi:MAG: ComEC/Rec2 family competence protein, partial [Clostridia bacterium]|nr:ComEC/Rec2 family competence protein [Clostridia bacterium]
MNILHRRPLLLCCTVFMLSSVIGLALPAGYKLSVWLLFLVCAILYAIFSLRRECSRSRMIFVAVVVLLTSVALLQSHFTFAGPQMTRLQELEQTTVRVKGTVTDRRGSGGNLTSYALELAAVNGERTSGMAVLTCYYVSVLQPGCEVELEATLIPLTEAAGDGYDATALRGDGYVIGLLSEDETTVTVLQENSKKLSVQAGTLRRKLAARLDILAGTGSKGLPPGLLLGERAYLADEVRRDFSRAGVSHMLAISGLHVTLLFGLLDGLLRLIRISKKFRAVLLATGAVGYLILLGFPPSATRATVMLGVTYLSYLLSSHADPLTSLGLSGALIMAFTPYAVADAGFWMSFLATLGLVTVMPPVWEWLNRPLSGEGSPLKWLLRRDLFKFISALLVGLIAMSFTLSIVAAVIGEMGILSPVSTLLLTPFCAVILLLSLLVLPFMGTAVGSFFGDLLQIVCSYTLKLTEWLAEPSWVVVSLRHPAVLPLASLMLGGVLVFLVIRLPTRRRWLVLLPILFGWTVIGGVLGIQRIVTEDKIGVTYLQPSSASDSLVMVSGQEGFICDLSNGSLSSMTAAAREAERRGATELSVLMLTHYHNRTSGALSTLLFRETVRALWLPSPESEEDYGYLLACLEKADLANVPVYMYDTGEELQVFGKGRLTLETTSIKRSEHPVLLVSMDVSLVETGNDCLVYCGAAV